MGKNTNNEEQVRQFYKGKRVLITGHTGFKGSWLSQLLLEFGVMVYGYALPPPKQSLFEILGLANHVNSHMNDIRNLAMLTAAVSDAKPDIIFHLAAQPIVREGYRNPVCTYETNVMGTVNLLEAARYSAGLKSIVNVTTDKVYENKEWPWGYREGENLCGFDPYSNSKSCSELVTCSYVNSFFNEDHSPAVSTARSGNAIGGGDFSPDRIIPDCIRFAEKHEKIIIRNPNSTRPYQHVLECLRGYLLLAKMQYEDRRHAGSYNFGPDESSCVTTEELVRIFCEKWGAGADFCVQRDDGPHEAGFLKLDISRARTVLGWAPRWSVHAAVARTIEWEKAYLESNAFDCARTQINSYFIEKEKENQ
jgi:CDP-glucose 4,6-dehydratase